MNRGTGKGNSKLPDVSHLHRFFIRPECVADGRVRIEGPAAKQMCSVLRLGCGDYFAALDGNGCALIVRISEAAATGVVGDVLDVYPLSTEPRINLILAQSLPKGDKLEFILQKGTELGVAKFEVVTTARTVAKPPEDRLGRRLARWRTIAKEAAEQSCRAIVPEVSGITALEALLPRLPEFDLALCLWEGEKRHSIREVLKENRSAENVMILTGPEGGFEEKEVRMMESAGARIIFLGPRVLRCETAAIAAAAIVLYELDS